MTDIMLDLERLRQAQAGIDESIEEFKNASQITDDLEDDIDRPDDRGELRDKASDFESAWNRKRDTLRENLENIQEQLKKIIEGWSDWDTETAAQLEGSEQTQTQHVNRVA